MSEDKTPSQIFNSLYEQIMEMCNNYKKYNKDEMEAKMKGLEECGKETYDKFEQLDKKFEEICKKNMELEEKIGLLYENLDKQGELMLPGDYESHFSINKNLYGEFWDRLDEKSKEFFITAHYIFDKIKSKQRDFSPVIIEFCRTYENELQTKIYTDFIQDLTDKDEQVVDSNSYFRKIEQAVEQNKNGGVYFLSLTDMIKYLGTLNKGEQLYGYKRELSNFFKKKSLDIVKLSDAKFVRDSKNYVINYRNEAAHPNLMDENSAIDCQEHTRDIIKLFIQSC